jgi:cytochrome c-type biogenesis protein CcmH
MAKAESMLAGAPASAELSGAPPAEMAQLMKLPPVERGDAIRGMVAALAARLAKEPGDLAGWKRLGRSYLVLGQAKDAADAYGKAAALAPRDEEAALGRAQALRAAQGETETLSAETIDAYRAAAALSPDEPEALWYLGLAAKQKGDAAEARKLWQRLAARVDPASGDGAEIKKQLDALGPAGHSP